MTGDELISDVRSLIQDEVAPYLWADEAILKLLRDAERTMCKQTHVLINTEVPLDVEADTATYTLDRRILRVYASRVAGSRQALGRLRGAAYGVHIMDTLGTPRHFTTNLGDKRVSFYPVPDAEYTIEMLCAVMPGTPVSEDTDSEIPEEHQHALVDYAAYRCLIIPDEDGESTAAAETYKESWLKYLRDLKRELYRYRTGDKLVLTHWTGTYNGRL